MKRKKEKPDNIQRAQDILYRAHRRVMLECDMRHDWSMFVVVSQAATSGICAEVVSSDQLMRDRGEKVIQQMTAQFASMLREDFDRRIEHEKAQTRQ
ncbi:hypothetical protein AFIC_001025 [[Pseudomonas] carboxydohydrogena]|uniref:Uncharacterized protein n=1 Tax=Afipia carboxydohydrogena TaxID=290 RepID=A0ABY8BS64_AFICR|nr:hypothetical protein [[Pseudomonas] carboxydohydrogena]WEF52534.1 hypothetical protein AFIC_001025 [[Pseudomonas] carboxydohydrogena]